LRMDPFQRQLSVAERDRIVIEAFAAAGERLKSCSRLSSPGSSPSRPTNLNESWEKMKPRITEWGLRRDPDLLETSMELVFGIEREGSVACGPLSDKDEALLLIAKLHEAG